MNDTWQTPTTDLKGPSEQVKFSDGFWCRAPGRVGQAGIQRGKRGDAVDLHLLSRSAGFRVEVVLLDLFGRLVASGPVRGDVVKVHLLTGFCWFSGFWGALFPTFVCMTHAATELSKQVKQNTTDAYNNSCGERLDLAKTCCLFYRIIDESIGNRF